MVDALRAEAGGDPCRRGRRAASRRAVVGAIEQAASARLAADSAPSLRRVINATGVIVHTNLGRAPLARAARRRASRRSPAATRTSNTTSSRGARGRRDVHAERLLCRLTGAEAAVVVNNNAAATLLVLAALAAGREVIISRGELVEIGGGFRVPDVMAQSGAVLREVGTTNRTRAADYAAAIGDRTALILRVHPSNFRIEGFTERPQLAELVALGRRFEIPVVEDLGSGYSPARRIGAGRPARRAGRAAQPRERRRRRDVQRRQAARRSAGRHHRGHAARRSSAIRAHPLMRALRVDKLTYAALEATLGGVRGRTRAIDGAGGEDARPDRRRDRTRAPTRSRPRSSSRGLHAGVADGMSTIGGGSAPGSALPTRLVTIAHPTLSATALEARLRLAEPPDRRADRTRSRRARPPHGGSGGRRDAGRGDSCGVDTRSQPLRLQRLAWTSDESGPDD